MIYDVNSVNTESEFNSIKAKLKRSDSVTYICKTCNTIVTKNSRCYKNFNNLCHSCAVKQTCLHKYGVTAPAKNSEINAKMQISRRKHQKKINAHISNSLKNRTEEQKLEAREKYERTCIEKYGIIPIWQQDKCRRTMLERYGAATTMQSEQLKAKVQRTNLERYGSISPASNNAVKQKIVNTYTQNNGGMGFASESAKLAQQLTMLEKYGVTHNMHSHELTSKMRKKYVRNGIMFDSKYEIIYYDYLVANNIDFVFHPDTYFEYTFDGKIRKYQPDFLVNGEFVELKGLHFFENYDATKSMINPFDRSQDALYEAKHQCMLQNHVKIITDVTPYIID